MLSSGQEFDEKFLDSKHVLKVSFKPSRKKKYFCIFTSSYFACRAQDSSLNNCFLGHQSEIKVFKFGFQNLCFPASVSNPNCCFIFHVSKFQTPKKTIFWFILIGPSCLGERRPISYFTSTTPSVEESFYIMGFPHSYH